ncbi:MAG: glutathione ABC transporter ATP-binding protein GsiA, partial [Paracoccaceae bacterium]|nr:glutathione ABC transporter ATP-binding protein GsiA [Paracoccaceae bacterium]
VEIGPREVIFANPAHPYTRRLLSAVPEPDPSRRLSPRPAPTGEVRSPIFPPDYIPTVRTYQQLGHDHLVIRETT